MNDRTHQPEVEPGGPLALPARLCPADAEALDSLIQSWQQADGATSAMAVASTSATSGPVEAARQQRLAAVLQLLHRDEAALVPSHLVHRTLQHVEHVRQRGRFAQQVQMLRGGSGSGGGARFLWHEVATVAAILLIGLSLLMPVLERNRATARQIACSTNLAAAGMGLARYAADHQGVIPRAAAEPGTTWYHVGQPIGPDGKVRSNSAHLFVMIRTGHVRADRLDCPENTHAPARLDLARRDWPSAAAVSYSYQNQFTAQPMRIDRAPHLAVLADKNPLFAIQAGGLSFRQTLPATAASQQHTGVGQGQNVLILSGSVQWLSEPIVRAPRRADDNIWLIHGQQTGYRGDETPTDPADDAFLVP